MAKTKISLYCKRCGIEIKSKFRIMLNSKREIDVCNECFAWSNNKTMAEIRADYKERARRKR